MNLLFSLSRYLDYVLFSRHKKGHGIHSPFSYDLLKSVLRKKTSPDEVEEYRDELLNDKRIIETNTAGAGSKTSKKTRLEVRKISGKSSIKPKYGRLLYQLVEKYQPKTILELGTSLGISTAYMAAANTDATIITIEAIEEKQAIAKSYHKAYNLSNIQYQNGCFEDVLAKTGTHKKYDFIFLDGDHDYQPTLKYFNMLKNHIHHDTIFVIDDIHWSKGMEAAWNKIKLANEVTLSIDLYQMGLIFFKKELSKEHLRIRY